MRTVPYERAFNQRDIHNHTENRNKCLVIFGLVFSFVGITANMVDHNNLCEHTWCKTSNDILLCAGLVFSTMTAAVLLFEPRAD